jgi:hypothetical protein
MPANRLFSHRRPSNGFSFERASVYRSAPARL